MKNKVNFTHLLLTIALGALLLQSFSNKITNEDPDPNDLISNMPIGSVFYSIVPPHLMKKKHGDKFTLLDGKILPIESNLHSYLSQEGSIDILGMDPLGSGGNVLPDGRGVFIRSMNEGRSSDEGDLSADRKVGSYQNDAIKEHQHKVTYKRATPNNSKGGPGNHKVTDGETSTNVATNQCVDCIQETRPRNITLYTYIVIN